MKILMGLFFAFVIGTQLGVITGLIFQSVEVGLAVFIFGFGLSLDVLFNSIEKRHGY